MAHNIPRISNIIGTKEYQAKAKINKGKYNAKISNPINAPTKTIIKGSIILVSPLTTNSNSS